MGQSKQSGFMGNVVELLDAQGNATFAPTEHLVRYWRIWTSIL
jgi:hypothetical protein